MPSSFRTGPNVTTYKTHMDGSTAVHTIFNGSVDELQWPDKVRRRKPLPPDLFRAGTYRKHVRVKYAPGGKAYLRAKNRPTYWQPYYIVGTEVHPTVSRDKTFITIQDENFDRLNNKLRAQARSSAVNLAMMLGEYRQCASLFRDLATDVWRLTKAALTRNPSAYQLFDRRTGKLRTDANMRDRAYRQIANRHLQYQYGVKPLMDDMQEVLHRLEDGLGRQLSLKLNKERVVLRGGQTSLTPWSDGSYFEQAWTRYTLKEKIVHQGSGEVYFNANALLNSVTPLGFTNPAALLYELTPYSFVLDWWVNVGEVLESLDSCLIIDQLIVAVSKRKTIQRKAELLNEVTTYDYSEYERFAPSAIGTVASLHYKPSVSLDHIGKGLALLVPLLSKINRNAARR